VPLLKPEYIRAANIATPDLRYRWDEWNVKEAYMPADPELLDRLKVLTRRANIALTIASAEWVIFRFEDLSTDPMPFQYLEAAWAGNVDLAYAKYIETNDDEWRGPVRGPLNMALTLVIDALFLEDENPNPAANAAWISNLAERVLPDKTDFRTWREASVERLEISYVALKDVDSDLFEDLDTKGPYVPREMFDPEYQFKPDQASKLISGFLAGLDYRKNPFLRSSEEMRKLGFRGTPYAL
jgi:hypothetical protein